MDAEQAVPAPPTAEAPTPTELAAADGSTSYHSPASGLAFEYPDTWMLDEVVLGSRAPTGIQLTSWAHEPGMIAEVQEGGTVMNIFVQLWDPKGDLAAFSENRRTAWESSGFEVVSYSEIQLADGRPAREYLVNSPDESVYYLFSTLGEDYLVASGSGDLESIARVARSMRQP